MQRDFFRIETTQQKLDAIDLAIESALRGDLSWSGKLSRDPGVVVLNPKLHPPKEGFATTSGLARMLHDLASIELQAMELAMRTLVEYPQAPALFREELALIARSESVHLRACLQALGDLGYFWGHWPVHTLLVDAVSDEDTLLDRILIVHRYLEGGGLDAGDQLLRRLGGLTQRTVAHGVLELIAREELGHVLFGSRWYHKILKDENGEIEVDFPRRMASIAHRLPKRVEKINHERRKQAGFLDNEIHILEQLREWQRQGMKEPITVALGNLGR